MLLNRLVRDITASLRALHPMAQRGLKQGPAPLRPPAAPMVASLELTTTRLPSGHLTNAPLRVVLFRIVAAVLGVRVVQRRGSIAMDATTQLRKVVGDLAATCRGRELVGQSAATTLFARCQRLPIALRRLFILLLVFRCRVQVCAVPAPATTMPMGGCSIAPLRFMNLEHTYPAIRRKAFIVSFQLEGPRHVGRVRANGITHGTGRGASC